MNPYPSPEREPLVIRQAVQADVRAIMEIYNEAIMNTVATFDTEPKTLEDRVAWFNRHDEKHPVLVAESGGPVVGWASLTAWSDRCAYGTTAEVSVYVHKEFRGRGIGKQLLGSLVDEAVKAGMHSLLARIGAGNRQSIHLHELFGFRIVGVMHEVGFKFGKFRDVTLMERVKK